MSRVDRLIADFQNGSVSRRQFIQGAAALGLSFSAISRLSSPVLAGSPGAVRWVSPRGTLDVLDDYP